MSADSLRTRNMTNKVLIPEAATGGIGACHQLERSSSHHVIRPQPVSEKTLMESVAGLINEVGLVPQVSRKLGDWSGWGRNL